MTDPGRFILFATGNSNKTKEIRNLLEDHLRISDLNELGFEGDLKEEGMTLEENALSKAAQALEIFDVSACFAEDTGLEVEALNGAPGVFSARFAGPQNDSAANINKLLELLDGQSNRTARFRTVIAYLSNTEKRTFEGIVNGKIALKPSGSNGFGYDPVFIPEGYEKTFGELPGSVKDEISHRARAFSKFLEFLKSLK